MGIISVPAIRVTDQSQCTTQKLVTAFFQIPNNTVYLLAPTEHGEIDFQLDFSSTLLSTPLQRSSLVSPYLSSRDSIRSPALFSPFFSPSPFHLSSPFLFVLFHPSDTNTGQGQNADIATH